MTTPAASTGIRLHVVAPLHAGAVVVATRQQAHYLTRVMRLSEGDGVALFNGVDGEWLGRIAAVSRHGCALDIAERLRPQRPEPDLWLLFAPVKRAGVDFLAAKATELGISALRPVSTRHAQTGRINTERLRANSVEAAEQSRRLTVPDIHDLAPLDTVLAAWPAERRLLVCDESGAAPAIADVLSQTKPGDGWAVLTGPEGGFADDERATLAALPAVMMVGLGPRILRAETAAVAALACLQALVGDWRQR